MVKAFAAPNQSLPDQLPASKLNTRHWYAGQGKVVVVGALLSQKVLRKANSRSGGARAEFTA